MKDRIRLKDVWLRYETDPFRTLHRLCLIGSIIFVTLAPLNGIAAAPKQVICIDNFNDASVNNHEGYVRALGLGANDVLQIGGNLTDCLRNVVGII